MLLGALVDKLGAPFDSDVLVRILKVENRDLDPRVALDVARFCASPQGVDEHVFAVPVDPHRRDLWRAVRVKGRETPEVLIDQKLCLFLCQVRHSGPALES